MVIIEFECHVRARPGHQGAAGVSWVLFFGALLGHASETSGLNMRPILSAYTDLYYCIPGSTWTTEMLQFPWRAASVQPEASDMTNGSDGAGWRPSTM